MYYSHQLPSMLMNNEQQENNVPKLVWANMKPTHLNVGELEKPEWSNSINNRLGHDSGRLPIDRDDCCMAWHFPGDAEFEPVVQTTTWSRLAAKARLLKDVMA